MGDNPVEYHPLPLFAPRGARLLMLGSFPPGRERWSMEFYYPNFSNDMWRIAGLVFFGERDHFVTPGAKRFDRQRIVAFLQERGIALGDTARAVIRLKGNASDASLEVAEPLDLSATLAAIPACEAIAVTGQKAMDTLLGLIDATEPPVGGATGFTFAGRAMRLYRMPSSSRAYPLPLADKAAAYRRMFGELGMISSS